MSEATRHLCPALRMEYTYVGDEPDIVKLMAHAEKLEMERRKILPVSCEGMHLTPLFFREVMREANDKLEKRIAEIVAVIKRDKNVEWY